MKKLIYLIVLALILGLVLTGCSLLSNISQVPTTEQSGITYLTKTVQLPDPGLVGLWHFDEGVGTTASDSSGKGNHGTVYSASWVESQSGFGKALSFDGTNSYVRVGHNTELNPTSAITVECWAKLDSVAPGPVLVRKLDTYSLQVTSLGGESKLEGWVKIGGVWQGVRGVSGGVTIQTNMWYHFAFTYDGAELKTYVNGQPDRSASVTGSIDSTTKPLDIGRCGPEDGSGNGWYTNGIIDEVRIWKTDLNQSQLDDMTAPTIIFTTPANGVTYLLNQTVNADWSADDGTGTGVASETGNVLSGLPIDTGTVGTKTFEVTATDYAKNMAITTVNYNVGYGFLGLLPPYAAPPKAFKIGSSIPLKWQYTLAGNIVDSSAANPSVEIKPVTTTDTTPTEGVPITVNDPGSSGLRYDSTTQTWQFNWQTIGLSAGLYNIRITSGQTGQTDGPFPIKLR